MMVRMSRLRWDMIAFVIFLAGSVAVTGSRAAAGGSSNQNEERVLNVYNWADYIAPDTVANF